MTRAGREYLCGVGVGIGMMNAICALLPDYAASLSQSLAPWFTVPLLVLGGVTCLNEVIGPGEKRKR